MLLTLALIAIVWMIALSFKDPLWRWGIAVGGTIACLGSPAGLASLFWLFSPRFRQQWKDYRRGGPPPGNVLRRERMGPDTPQQKQIFGQG
jgi:hypothetical protein